MIVRFMTLVFGIVVLLFSGPVLAEDPAAAPPEAVQAPPDKAMPERKAEDAGKAKAADKNPARAQKDSPGVESGVTKQAAEAERPQPELDRRWIIKMKDEKNRKLPARKPVTIAWAGKDQQTRCEAFLPGLQEAFSKTRYYSVGGDACNTAGSARAFLDLVRNCERDCPQGFLEAKGYSRQIIRNVEILHQLGQKRCTESVRETGPVTSGKKPEKKASEKPIR